MWLHLKTILLELVLFSVCVLGDYNLSNPILNHRLAIAVCDSLTHGIVGAVSWAIVCNIKGGQDVAQCLLCMVIAMAVDIDHFLAANSLDLKMALSLQNRPPFHSSSLILLMDLVLLLLAAMWRSRTIVLFMLIFTVASTSHHIRDGVRRGMWFYPVGSTSPLPRNVYIGAIMLLPLVFKLIYNSVDLRNQEIIASIDPIHSV